MGQSPSEMVTEAFVSTFGSSEVTERKPDGTIITKKDNPYVKCISMVIGGVIVLAIIDGGNGMITKTLGKYK